MTELLQASVFSYSQGNKTHFVTIYTGFPLGHVLKFET